METTRAEIYEAVWAHPLAEVARRFGMSAGGLSKLCHRLDIPYPPKGYWRRGEKGRSAVSRPPLPINDLPADDPISFASGRSTSRRPRSRLTPDQRAAQMMQAAAEIIEAEGLAACTITRIAEHAGVSESLAFKYCGSRSAIIARLARRELAELHAYRREQVKKGRTLEERVRLSTLAYLEQMRDRGQLLHVLLNVPEVNREITGEVDAQIEKITPVTADFVASKSRWKGDEAQWKTLALTAATRRMGALLGGGAGTFDECAKVALALTGISRV